MSAALLAEISETQPFEDVMIRCLRLMLALMMHPVGLSRAEVLLFGFTAEVTLNAGSPLVQLGDIVTGTLAYDVLPTSAFHHPASPLFYTWDRPPEPIGLTVNFNGHALSQNRDNFLRIFVMNDSPGTGDQFEVSSYLGPRQNEDPFLYTGPELDLALTDPSARAFDSSDLPTNLSLSDFAYGKLWVYDGVNPYFQASLTSFALVPEPSALLLLVSGAALIYWRRRA